MFSPEDHVLQIAPLRGGSLSQTALGVLFGETDLRKVFDVERIDEEESQDHVWLRLHPRKDASFERLELSVDRETLDVQELVIHDLLGNRTRLRLEGIEQNLGLEEDAFTIQVPDDTEVIDLR
jgi:outer membrane lipoprotein-sorting protein